jgi:WbqC-like protein family
MSRDAPTPRASHDVGHDPGGATTKRVAILQSSYIPWKGYFDIIASVDEFILYDTASYSKGDWRNRNRIKTHTGLTWLTIPIRTSGRFGQPIQDVEVHDARWASTHWKSIETNYGPAPYFDRVAPMLRDTYARAAAETHLSRISEIFLEAICALLGIRTRITHSSDYELRGDRTARLVHLCEQSGGTEYLSGPAAKAYLEVGMFADRGIAVRWMNYAGYPEYGQLHCPPFVHEVSILDLLLTEGPAGARRFMLAWREDGRTGGPRIEAEGHVCSSPL